MKTCLAIATSIALVPCLASATGPSPTEVHGDFIYGNDSDAGLILKICPDATSRRSNPVLAQHECFIARNIAAMSNKLSATLGIKEPQTGNDADTYCDAYNGNGIFSFSAFNVRKTTGEEGGQIIVADANIDSVRELNLVSKECETLDDAKAGRPPQTIKISGTPPASSPEIVVAEPGEPSAPANQSHSPAATASFVKAGMVSNCPLISGLPVCYVPYALYGLYVISRINPQGMSSSRSPSSTSTTSTTSTTTAISRPPEMSESEALECQTHAYEINVQVKVSANLAPMFGRQFAVNNVMKYAREHNISEKCVYSLLGG
ncbi:MAG TPA: hypothetical protein VGH80_07095 [Xanthomonadaceae bacterium]